MEKFFDREQNILDCSRFYGGGFFISESAEVNLWQKGKMVVGVNRTA